MKKNLVQRTVATGLTFVTVASMAGCGSKPTANNQSDGGPAAVGKITVMTDTTVRADNGGEDFWSQLRDLTGLDIQYVQPDHASYLEAVSNAFNGDSVPDVVQLSSDYYALFAANGFLWDTTDAWENSNIKKSGRLKSNAEAVMNALKVTGPDGEKRLYGFTATNGNGCLTYIKKKALDDCNIPVSDIENKTMDWNTYYNYLKKMANYYGHYVVSGPGLVSMEAPYTNYLPEFYQDAYFSFYENSQGKYVDGFAEDAMKKAIERLTMAINDGVLDKETVNNTTGTSRDKFEDGNQDQATSVFTYWAGTWENSLQLNLQKKGYENNELIPIKPIKELGKYYDRIPTCWAITSFAKNPEGIFKYFVEAMYDGGKGQTLWTYGAENTHWTREAGTVTLAGKEDQVTTFEEGKFHMLPTPGKEDTLYSRNCFDPLLLIMNFDGDDPGKESFSDIARQSEAFFNDNAVLAPAVPSGETYADDIGDINTARKYVLAQVCLGYMSYDEGMSYYNSTVGTKVDEVLKSLNK